MTEREPPSVLRLLRDTEDTPLSSEAEAERRRRIVSRIEMVRAELSVSAAHEHLDSGQHLADIRRVVPKRWAKHWKATAAVVLPLAAALLIWVTTRGVASVPLVRVEAGQVEVESTAGAGPLHRDETWDRANDVVVATRENEATVVLPSRTTVEFAPQSRAGIERSASLVVNNEGPVGPRDEVRDERVHLRQGSVTLDVPQLAPERSFSVVTAQAKVVVRRALFAVLIETSSSNAEQTRVVVRQGEVSVWSGGRERRVSAGQEWSSQGEHPATAGAPNDDAPVSVSVLSGRDAGAAPAPKSAAVATTGASDLARQNQMFESAQAARRAGQSDLALRRFVELMRAFPRSEQAHNARVEHFRLLRSLGKHAEARQSARAYLRSHPRGFAAAEARRLVD
jgi:hypothetical protein